MPNIFISHEFTLKSLGMKPNIGIYSQGFHKASFGIACCRQKNLH
jgi:hypothetical protein